MATRMQQRRGTAAQWTSADPILASGEIGFESDTSQFKIGDGTNHWTDLSYFKNLEDLGGTLDDYIPLSQRDSANGVATLDADGYIPVTQLGNIIGDAPAILNTLDEIAAVLNDSSTAVNTRIDAGLAANEAAFATELDSAIGAEITARNLAISAAVSEEATSRGLSISEAILDEVSARGAAIAASATSVLNAAETDATNKANAAQTAAEASAQSALNTHTSDTTNVHGISDTSLLALKSEVAAVTKTTIGLGNVDNTADTAKPVSTAQATAIAAAKSEAIASATAQVDALLTGAPAALNTLDELAAALGDDANFAASVTTALDGKVPSYTSINQTTSAYTTVLSDRDKLVEVSSASGVTVTIPTNASVAYPVGTSIDILQTGAGQVTIAGAGGVTVNATPGLKLRTQWSSATLFKRATDTWVVFGDLSA